MFTFKIKKSKNSTNTISAAQQAFMDLFTDKGPYYLRKSYETDHDKDFNKDPKNKNRKKSFAFTMVAYTGLGQLQQLSMSGVNIQTEHFHVLFDPSGAVINKIFSGYRDETFETWNEWEGVVEGITTVWGTHNGALKVNSAFTADPSAISLRE